MIENNFDVSFISNLSKREKQIQQSYRPIIAVHKWFARRPGTLFRGLLLSEFVNSPLKDAYYRCNNLKNITIVDPFMGGGTPLIEANRIGCNVIGYDINPMAYWIVKEEIESINLDDYKNEAYKLIDFLQNQMGNQYKTKCLYCGELSEVKYYLWVKVIKCVKCDHEIDLFPGYLIAQNDRHPKNVLVCSKCGILNEVDDINNLGFCQNCRNELILNSNIKRNKCICSECGEINSYSRSEEPPKHRMFAIEYYCDSCKTHHDGRFFKIPDNNDLSYYEQCKKEYGQMSPKFVPQDKIPMGDETERLHRWGYTKYSEMFNLRQLVGLEYSCRYINNIKDERIKNALSTNLSDLLRYQNMLCRYDSYALKSLDIFSIHGFPVSLIQCESNLLGIIRKNGKGSIGSGGWLNIIDKYIKAKSYCSDPFEYRHIGNRKIKVDIVGEWIGDQNENHLNNKQVELYCKNSMESNLKPNSVDGIFTDPPYGSNVQYAELMDFCYVWLKQLVNGNISEFNVISTRNENELTINKNMGRDIESFTEGLSKVFCKMAKSLKNGAPLAFTYHYNDIEGYYPVIISILDSGLVCSASIPCPAEMGASIHINGTQSSIIDTIFICRNTGKILEKYIAHTPEQLSNLVIDDITKLAKGDVKVTDGDIKCIVLGHLSRITIWNLYPTWNKNNDVKTKMNIVRDWIYNFSDINTILKYIDKRSINNQFSQNLLNIDEVRENAARIKGEIDAEISF